MVQGGEWKENQTVICAMNCFAYENFKLHLLLWAFLTVRNNGMPKVRKKQKANKKKKKPWKHFLLLVSFLQSLRESIWGTSYLC